MHGKLLKAQLVSTINVFIVINNCCILKSRSLFSQPWIKGNIIYIKELVDNNRDILKYETFISKFQFPIRLKDYQSISQCIPSGLLHLIKGHQALSNSVMNTNQLQVESMYLIKSAPIKQLEKLHRKLNVLNQNGNPKGTLSLGILTGKMWMWPFNYCIPQ